MAVKKKISLEESLWKSCDKLRGTVEPAEYKHVVLALIFLKFVGDKFEKKRNELIEAGQKKYIEMEAFYNQDNVFFLQSKSRWDYIKSNAKQDDIALKIDTALHQIEKNNSSLKGALPNNYFSRLGIEKSKLASLVDEIGKIDTNTYGLDIIGRIYEYFLKKFSIKEKDMKGEFYTPKSVVNLIAGLIEPYKGIIYDPACGTGGMFVQSVEFIKSHEGNQKEVSIYGQESLSTTYRLSKMNLAIRGITANLGDKAADTFATDLHSDLKADYIMANPPFNQKDWRSKDELIDDHRWRGYEVPPVSNANYGWILNMVSKLSENGVAGFLLSNGALDGGGDEFKIRKKLIENNLVEAIIIIPRETFYSTDISVTLWILNKNKKERAVNINDKIKKYRNRNEILFMDLRQWGSKVEKKFIELTEEEIKKVVNNYHNWQQEDFKNTYKNVPEFCYSAPFEEIEKKDFSLVPSRYIEFIDADSNIDFDKEMSRIQKDFKKLLKDENQSQEQLIEAFKKLGYDL